MGFRGNAPIAAPAAPAKAAAHAPEGTSGADLSDFESAFGGMFTGDTPPVPKAQPKSSIFTEEDEDEELENGDPAVIEPPKPIEKDPLEGMEEAQKHARERYKLQKEMKELKEEIAKLKSAPQPAQGNPLKGKTNDEIVDLAMAAMEGDGSTTEQAKEKLQEMTPEQIIAKAKEEFRKEQEEKNTKSEQEKAAAEAVNNFKEGIKTFVKEKAAEFPSLEAFGATDQIYAMIEQDYLKKEEEFGSEYAQKNIMKTEIAAKKVEETLASEVRKALKSPHMRKFILNLAKEGNDSGDSSSDQLDEFSQLEDEGARTLTNSVHRKVTDPKDIRTLSDDEQLEQSFAYLT